MADLPDQLRNFLWQEAKKRRHWWIKSSARPNGKRMAADLELSQATLSRALRGHRENLGDGGAKRPFQLSGEMLHALMSYFGFDEAGVYDAVRHADPAPPRKARPRHPKRSPRRR